MKLYKNTLRYEVVFLTTEPRVFSADEVHNLKSRFDMFGAISNVTKCPSKIQIEVKELDIPETEVLS